MLRRLEGDTTLDGVTHLIIDEVHERSEERFLYLQSNLLMWSPLLRDHLSSAATFSGSLEPKCSANEPVLRGHLS